MERRNGPQSSFHGFRPPLAREGWFPCSGYRGGVRGCSFNRRDALDCSNPTLEQMARHCLLVLTPVLSCLFTHVLAFEFQVGDLRNVWLIDSGCSRHMTGDKGWFSCLILVVSRTYITFRDNGRGRVLSEGEIKVSDKVTLRCVALVQLLGFNLLSVSQLLDEGFEVLFRLGGSRILDSRGDLVCMVVPDGQLFRADFSQYYGVERCFLASSLSEL
jgi:hypothetical protein